MYLYYVITLKKVYESQSLIQLVFSHSPSSQTNFKWYLAILVSCLRDSYHHAGQLILVIHADGQFQSIVPVCICPGDNLIYICSTVGPRFTTWKGSALQCPSHQIVLFHRDYEQNKAIGTCGSSTAQGISITDNNSNYTSQLNITYSDHLNGTDIQCHYDDGITQTPIGNATIMSTGSYIIIMCCNQMPSSNLLLCGYEVLMMSNFLGNL